jgi:hypothetical protein
MNVKSFGYPHGLGIGGTTERFRVFIPESFEHCVARSTCLTFEQGQMVVGGAPTVSTIPSFGEDLGGMVEKGDFEIDVLECWGCGGT